MLIAGRALQGTAGAGLFQMVMIIISDIFSMRQRTLFLGLLEIMWAVAGALGPVLGGTFTEVLTWRWCFWINLPIAGAAFLLLSLFLDVHNPRTRMLDGLKAIDWLGSFSIVGMTLLFLLGLDFGGAIFPWDSPKVFCLIIAGALCSAFFWICEKRWAQYPISVRQRRLSTSFWYSSCAHHRCRGSFRGPHRCLDSSNRQIPGIDVGRHLYHDTWIRPLYRSGR